MKKILEAHIFEDGLICLYCGCRYKSMSGLKAHARRVSKLSPRERKLMHPKPGTRRHYELVG